MPILRRRRHAEGGARASASPPRARSLVDGRCCCASSTGGSAGREAWARPTFLYFNFQSAHFPYAIPDMPRSCPASRSRAARSAPANRDWVERTYWNAIAYNDRLIGALLARLERLGVLDDTLIVVTADHGESLFDDGFLGHGHVLNASRRGSRSSSATRRRDAGGRRARRHARHHPARAAGAAPPPPARASVFQYLGDARPAGGDRHRRARRAVDDLRPLPRKSGPAAAAAGPATAICRRQRRTARRRRA